MAWHWHAWHWHTWGVWKVVQSEDYEVYRLWDDEPSKRIRRIVQQRTCNICNWTQTKSEDVDI